MHLWSFILKEIEETSVVNQLERKVGKNDRDFTQVYNNMNNFMGISGEDTVLTSDVANITTVNATTVNSSVAAITEQTDVSWDISNLRYYYWQFNEGYEASAASAAGVEAGDVGGSHPLTVTNVAGWSSANKGFKLDGSTYVATEPDTVDLEPVSGDFTYIGTFTSPTATAAGNQTFFSKQASADATNRFWLYQTGSAGTVTVRVAASSSASVSTLTPSTKYVFVLRRTSGTVVLRWTATSESAFDHTDQVTFADGGSVGVNAATFDIGRCGTSNFSGAMIHQQLFTPFNSISDENISRMFLEFKNDTNRLRGVDSSQNPNLPSSESGINKIFSTTDKRIYSHQGSGLQLVTGGIKIGNLMNTDSVDTSVANTLSGIKYICLQDCIINYMAITGLTTTQGAQFVMGVYEGNRTILNDWYPTRLLGQTDTYYTKLSDNKSIMLVKLQNPIKLEFGKTYFLAINNANDNIDIATWESVTDVSWGYFVTYAFTGTLPTNFPTGGTAELPYCIAGL